MLRALSSTRNIGLRPFFSSQPAASRAPARSPLVCLARNASFGSANERIVVSGRVGQPLISDGSVCVLVQPTSVHTNRPDRYNQCPRLFKANRASGERYLTPTRKTTKRPRKTRIQYGNKTQQMVGYCFSPAPDKIYYKCELRTAPPECKA